MQLIDTLLTRRSATAKDMKEPGPSDDELTILLRAAHRVPDHGKLGPWRFVVFRGAARASFGEKLAEITRQDNPDAPDKLIDFQRRQLLRAPLVVAVISTAEEHVKIPKWEQILSAGAACQNMLVAASALGYAAQWLTEWYSYDDRVKTLLDMKPHHRIAGFLYFGSVERKPDDRARPSLDERISHWPAG